MCIINYRPREIKKQHSRSNIDLLERVQRRPQQPSEGWVTSAVRKG